MIAATIVITGQVHAQWGYGQAPEPSLFEKFVLPLAGAAVGGVFGNVINFYGGKLINALSSEPPPKQTSQQQNQQQQQSVQNLSLAQYNIPVNSAGMLDAVYQPAPPPVPQNVSAVTGVMYILERLRSDYSVAETIQPQLGVAPTFQSNEAFAIRYTSNQPGVVVVMNVDALQKTAYLGTFVVSPGAEMRFPEQVGKGMRLDNNVGLETYQMLFMACLPPQMANQPDVIARKGKIPECGPTALAEQTIMLAQKGRRTKGTYNEVLQQADGTKNVVLSVAPYQKGDITTTTFTINHVPALAEQQPQHWQSPPALPSQTQSSVTGTL